MNLRRCFPIIAGLVSVLVLFLSDPVRGQESNPQSNSRLARDIGAATSMVEVGDFERALAFLDQMQKTYGPSTHIDALYKRIYAETKMYPEYEAIVQKQLAETPDNPLLLAELASIRFLLDDSGGADSLWNLALETGKESQSTYIAVAAYKLRFGDYDGAVSAYEQGRRNLGNPYLFTSNLANVYESKREYDHAVEEYLLQLEQNPNSLGIVSSHVRGLLEDSDNPEEIVATVKKGVSRFNDPEIINKLLGDLYIRLGQFDKALDTYKAIGSGKKDDGASLYEFARRCYDYRSYRAAVRAIDEYFVTSKDEALRERALLLKGRAQRALGSVEQAINILLPLFNQASDLNVRDNAGYEVGSVFAVEKEDCEQAASIWGDLLRTAHSRDIIDVARVDLASCLIKMDQLEKADSLLTAATSGMKSGAESERASFLKGEIALFTGDYDRAARIYRRLIKDSPGSDFTNNALERLMVIEAEKNDDKYSPDLDRFAAGAKARAMGRFEEAAGIFSDEAFVKSSIGEQALFAAALTYREADENDLAMMTLKEYVEKYPQGFYVDRALLNLGDLYLLKKETRSLARDAFNKILEDFPDGPVSEQARGRLKALETPDEIG